MDPITNFAVANWLMIPAPWPVNQPPSPANQRWLMTLTGVAIIDFKGNGPNWKWDGVDLWIDISGPLAATGRQAAPQKILGFQVDQWAPFASLNSIYDDRTAVNAGFAVDSFSVLLVNTGTERIPNVFGIADQYRQTGTLHVNAAVRDIDAWLYRIGYCVNLLGRPVEYTPQPI